MKKILFLITAVLLIGCSSNDIKKEREEVLSDKEKVTANILKPDKVLTLDEAIKIGVDRNLDLKTKEIEREIAKYDKRIAFGNFLPKLSVTYSRTLFNEQLRAKALDTGLEDIPKQIAKNPALATKPYIAGLAGMFPTSLEARLLDKDFAMFGVNAQLPIFVPSTWFLYSAKSKGENISVLTRDLTEKMIKLQTIGKYYHVLALESENDFLKREVEATEQLKHNAELGLETGSILPWENKRVEVFNEVKKHALKENERDLQLAKISLLNTLDLYPFADIKLQMPKFDEKEDITLDTAIYEALENSDILKIREEGQKISKDVKKIAITNFLPKIMITGGYVNTNAEALVNQNFFMGTIGGIFSIFNGFQNVNEYKIAREKEKIAYIKKEQEMVKIIYETVNAYNQMGSAKEEKNIADHNFEAMEGMINQKKLERETGTIDDWEYIQALADFEKALSLKEKADLKYRMACATLDMLMGKSIFTKGDNGNEKK